MYRFLAVLLFFASFTSSVSAEDGRRDGNWWNSLVQSSKPIYVVGVFDGMELGKNFSIWKSLSGSKEDGACASKALTSFDEFSAKYAEHVTAGQLADGLNAFYSDYRNRSIRIDSAVWLVLNSIAGTPEQELNRMIENFRKNPG